MSRSTHDALCGVCGVEFMSNGMLACNECLRMGAHNVGVIKFRGIDFRKVPDFVRNVHAHIHYRAYLACLDFEPLSLEELSRHTESCQNCSAYVAQKLSEQHT